MPQIITQSTLIGSVLFEWDIVEYRRYRRGVWWYIFLILLSVGLVIFGLFTQNFLFSFIVILFGIILFLQAHQEPLKLPFAITDLGIVLGNRFYGYAEFESFYIIYQPPHVKTLYIATKNLIRPVLRIPLEDMDPLDIRHVLKEFLDEDLTKDEEPFTDAFVRNWKIN